MKPTAFLHRLPSPLRQRPALAAGGAVLLLALLVWFAWPKPSQASTSYHEVRRGDFTVSIVEGGTLTAVSEVSIRNEVEGTARIIYIVPEGSYVKKGDLLVELDSAQAQDQVNQQNINMEKAQFALVQAEAQLDIQRSTTNSDIRAATLKVKFAELDLRKFLEGQQVVDLVEASNKVVQAEANLAVNIENFMNSTNLEAKGYETKQRVDGDRLAVMNTRNSLIVASNQLWMLKQFDVLKQREKFESDLREAEQELQRVVAQSERRIAQFEADLITQSNTVALSQKKLDRDRKNLNSTKILAPQDGLVVYPVGENRFSQESLIEEGAVVRNRQELIKLPDVSRMKVTIKVHESHVNMVHPGQPAFVTLDSMPDQRFVGYVEKVGLLPDTSSRWGNPNLKVYNTDIYITDRLADTKPGVSAKAEVIITNIANALSVPVQAVTTLNGRQVVYTLRGSSSEAKPVEVGMYNTRFIEVLAGISEGARVLLSPPFDTKGKDLEGAVLTEEERAKVATNALRTASSGAARANSASAKTNLPPNFASARPSTVPVPVPVPPGSAPDASARPGDDLSADSVAGGAGARGTGGRRPGGGGMNREEMMKQFDKDGDGQLSDEEREVMRAAMMTRFGGQGGPGGGSGGGGGQGAPRLSREEMLKRFDKDGDGELSDDERNAMRQASGGSRTNRSDRARGDGPRGGGNGPNPTDPAAPGTANESSSSPGNRTAE